MIERVHSEVLVLILILATFVAVKGAFVAQDTCTLQSLLLGGSRPGHSHHALSIFRKSTSGGLDQRGKQGRTISSNFWHSVVRREQGGDDSNYGHVPCVPTLDRDGTLPVGAYLSLGDSISDPKDTCRLAVAIDLPSLKRSMSMDGGEASTLAAAEKIHDFIDAGLTTFYLKSSNFGQQAWGEQAVLGSLRRETPPSVMKNCQFVVPMALPIDSGATTGISSVRELVLESLLRSGGDSIDCLQVQYDNASQYVFDVLDSLEDLKREGLVRSISCNNMPPGVLRRARQYGFSIDSSRVDMNLLDHSVYSTEQRLACQDLGTPLLVSGALAGGLLTNRYVGRDKVPFPWEFSLAERRHWNSDFQVWRERRGYSSAAIWEAYQSRLLGEMESIAMKHRVSVGSVALRWSLQLDHVASAIVTCRLIHPENGSKRKDRAQELREVFRFELDEEDMERLWDISGRNEHIEPRLDLAKGESMFDEMMESDESGLFLPAKIDLTDKKLWL